MNEYSLAKVQLLIFYIGISWPYIFQLFVLIVSSCISRNKYVMRRTTACYEHLADADISFLAKGQDRKMSACTFSMAPLHFAYLYAIISRPPSPCFRLKTLSISRQPTLLVACCYRRTFPPVFLK